MLNLMPEVEGHLPHVSAMETTEKKNGDDQKKFTFWWQLPPTHRSTHSRWLKGDSDSIYD